MARRAACRPGAREHARRPNRHAYAPLRALDGRSGGGFTARAPPACRPARGACSSAGVGAPAAAGARTRARWGQGKATARRGAGKAARHRERNGPPGRRASRRPAEKVHAQARGALNGVRLREARPGAALAAARGRARHEARGGLLAVFPSIPAGAARARPSAQDERSCSTACHAGSGMRAAGSGSDCRAISSRRRSSRRGAG
jgi:hypothetical protein